MQGIKRLVVIFWQPRVAHIPSRQRETRNPRAGSKRLENVNIIRDDFGIAHVYGKTDADTVFGTEYAQAEDDFNRVETNYINAMGRLAETEGESKSTRICG